VASVKNVCVNCASHWMPPLPLQVLQPLPLKSVRLASRAKSVRHVKSASRAHRVKSVNHVPSKPLQPAKKKY